MDDFTYLQQMPMVRKLRADNFTLKRKNKELKKKNKDLNRLVKLVLNNLHLLDTNGVDISKYRDIVVKEEPVRSEMKIDIVKQGKSENECDSNPENNNVVYKMEIKGENGSWHSNSVNDDCLLTNQDEEEESDEEEEVVEVEKEVEVVVVDEEVEEEGGDGEDSPAEEEDDGEDSPVDEEGGDGGDSPVEEENEVEDSTAEEEDEVEEVTIKGKTYYTTGTTDGLIYDTDADGEISMEVGKYENGKPVFYKK